MGKTGNSNARQGSVKTIDTSKRSNSNVAMGKPSVSRFESDFNDKVRDIQMNAKGTLTGGITKGPFVAKKTAKKGF